MGYTHYWRRPEVIDLGVFTAIRGDFENLILPLADVGVLLAGGLGEGAPEITEEVIRFNGLKSCGHPRNDEIVIPYPSESAEGIGPSCTAIDDHSDGLITIVKHRCCNGSCDYETFSLPRRLEEPWRNVDERGSYGAFVKTGFRPYDIAVTAALLVAKKHLKDRFEIESNGGDRQWADARRLCQRVLGYGDWFGIVEQRLIEQRAEGEPREVRLRTVVELDPTTL